MRNQRLEVKNEWLLIRKFEKSLLLLTCGVNRVYFANCRMDILCVQCTVNGKHNTRNYDLFAVNAMAVNRVEKVLCELLNEIILSYGLLPLSFTGFCFLRFASVGSKKTGTHFRLMLLCNKKRRKKTRQSFTGHTTIAKKQIGLNASGTGPIFTSNDKFVTQFG